MSLDLYVHGKSSKRITTNQLTKAFTKRQINAAIFEDYVHYQPAARGPIESCTILGWNPAMFDRARLMEALGCGDKKQLNRLFAKKILAYANVSCYDADEHYDNFGDNYLESLAGEIDDEFLDFMKLSKVVYEIQTSAGRSDFSWRFQMAVCCIIAETATGLIEEPQSAEYFFPKDAECHFRGFAQ